MKVIFRRLILAGEFSHHYHTPFKSLQGTMWKTIFDGVWYISLIPGLGKLRQGNLCEFEGCMVYNNEFQDSQGNVERPWDPVSKQRKFCLFKRTGETRCHSGKACVPCSFYDRRYLITKDLHMNNIACVYQHPHNSNDNGNNSRVSHIWSCTSIILALGQREGGMSLLKRIFSCRCPGFNS